MSATIQRANWKRSFYTGRRNMAKNLAKMVGYDGEVNEATTGSCYFEFELADGTMVSVRVSNHAKQRFTNDPRVEIDIRNNECIDGSIAKSIEWDVICNHNELPNNWFVNSFNN